jgi:ferredoxin-thioredoxin reductase catalytic chain
MKSFVFQLLIVAQMLSSFAFAFAFAPSRISNKINHSYSHSYSHSHTNTNKSTSKLHLKDEGMSPEEREIAIEKATKAMTAFSNKYIENTNTKYCSDLSIPAVVIKGLAEHKVTLGAPLCPCRFYDDKEKEAKDGFWNCPCVPMRERHECHCMLFITEDNDFVGEDTVITYEEVVEKAGGISM